MDINQKLGMMYINYFWDHYNFSMSNHTHHINLLYYLNNILLCRINNQNFYLRYMQHMFCSNVYKYTNPYNIHFYNYLSRFIIILYNMDFNLFNCNFNNFHPLDLNMSNKFDYIFRKIELINYHNIHFNSNMKPSNLTYINYNINFKYN